MVSFRSLTGREQRTVTHGESFDGGRRSRVRPAFRIETERTDAGTAVEREGVDGGAAADVERITRGDRRPSNRTVSELAI